MDLNAALNIAGGILSFVQLGRDLAPSQPATRGSLSNINSNLVSERLGELQTVLSSAEALAFAPEVVRNSDAQLTVVFRDTATACLDCINLLQEKTTNAKGDEENRGEPVISRGSKAGPRHSMFPAQRWPGLNELDRFAGVVTHYIKTVVRAWASETRKVVESLKSDIRYARPEYESRVDSMSQDLADLGNKLKEPANHPDANSMAHHITESDLKTIQTLVARLYEAEDHMIVDKIVASLNYDSRPVRHDSVPQAHKDTFRWAFDSQLADWFRSGSGTFWISGKPGSGKSTFMKYVSSHQQTRELLSVWAGSTERLAIAAHFFWIAGTPIQKSWQGLFQSLLFDTFHKQPAVVKLISPRRWSAAKRGDWQEAAEPWSVTELGMALRALATAPEFPIKLCFFIDGLDEYDSDHEELCNILCDMARSPHIKICLSSRPWPVFEERFGADRTKRIDIHELTKDDIQRFVIDQLRLPGSKDSGIADADRDEICRKVATGADGVFLWAFFVTKSLREDLSNGATIADLRNRLVGLPGDLEQLFRTILESVDMNCHAQMAGILQAAAHALEPLHVDLYWMLEKEFESPDHARRCPIRAITYEELTKRRQQATHNVNDKTKGLLKLVNQRFEFLHRTVKDFVLTRDMGNYLKEKLPADYNGYTAIAVSYLGFLKSTSLNNSIVAGVVRLGQGRNSGPFTSHLNEALVYVSEALNSDRSQDIMDLLKTYEETVDQMIRIGHVTLRGLNAEDSDPRLLFREELLRHRLTPYLSQRLRETPDFLDVFDEPPLYAAVMPMSLSSGESPAPVPEIVDILLRRGEDPNATTRSRPAGKPYKYETSPSPWVLFAREVMSIFNIQSGPCMFPAMRFNGSLDDGIFEILLSHGADPNASLVPDKPLGSHTAFSHFLDISMSQFLGAECFKGYLRTLSAFLRAGASLGVPSALGTGLSERPYSETNYEEAFGNLARDHPEESILTSFCTELKTMLSRLVADPERANFVQSLITELIAYCTGREDELRELASATSKGCPEHIQQVLLPIIERELGRKEAMKRNRGSWDGALSNKAAKHIRN